jgi:hypothetical protein
MRSALADLELEQLVVLYPGSRSYDLAPRARVVPVSMISTGDIDSLLPRAHGARSRRRKALD